MIIECPCGKKKYEVDSSLIPPTGREIQCGSCNRVWFYIPNLIDPPQIETEKEVTEKNLINEINEKKENLDQKVDKIIEKRPKKNSSLRISKILSYLIVIIISFVAVILVIETFKSQLINIFPGLELILYNLFESIKDIVLFIKNLSA